MGRIISRCAASTSLRRKINGMNEVDDAQVLFLALPHGHAMKAIKQFNQHTVIDTSADFRLHDQSVFEEFYHSQHFAFEHTQDLPMGCLNYLEREIKMQTFAAPGCFSDQRHLSVYPLVAEGFCQEIIINAVTGLSGSGIKPKDKSHYPFVRIVILPYESFTHRHLPEIQQAIKDKTKCDIDLLLQPHSGPFSRWHFCYHRYQT